MHTWLIHNEAKKKYTHLKNFNFALKTVCVARCLRSNLVHALVVAYHRMYTVYSSHDCIFVYARELALNEFVLISLFKPIYEWNLEYM